MRLSPEHARTRGGHAEEGGSEDAVNETGLPKPPGDAGAKSKSLAARVVNLNLPQIR